MIKKENKMKKYDKKYNSVINTLLEQIKHSFSNRNQKGIPIYAKQHKLTNNTLCHLYHNDILITNRIKIKITAQNNNTIKHTQ
jgi:hypothetical protein